MRRRRPCDVARVSTRRIATALAAGVLLAACGTSTGTPPSEAGGEPFPLPVGPSEWKRTSPAWLLDGTLHVGGEQVRLARDAGPFVLGATGAYWMRGSDLMFTSTAGETQLVAPTGWGNIAISADHTVVATVDQSRGPTDQYGTHVMQVAAFDTRTGEQLYRTPDEEPDRDADLADGYSETMPLLDGVSDTRLFYAGRTIELDDGSSTPWGTDPEGGNVYEGYRETLFPDGYRVAVRERGAGLELADSEAWGVGRLSPDRSTLFDVTRWPTPAVAYDAETGHRRVVDAPWDHLILGPFDDEGSFTAIAQQVGTRPDVGVGAQQVVQCRVATLRCTPVSPVVRPRGVELPTLMLEGDPDPYF